jgi:DGQHR domain-containing protein
LSIFKFRGLLAQQGNSDLKVIMITARASEVRSFATIPRAGRDGEGALRGFQRTQISTQVGEIRDYLRTDGAVLPMSLTVGFFDHIKVKERSEGWVEVIIDASDGPPGYLVDGQQRLAALAGLPEKDFELFVCIFFCRKIEELRRQFLLINSARPLPRKLVHELLPQTEGLPGRYRSRIFAAALADRLNLDCRSSLCGLIQQHTNPKGVIRDTAIHAVIMRSLSDGAIREMPENRRLVDGFRLLSAFYGAVKKVFSEEWEGHTTKSSRLVDGVGIQALGYVMELLVGRGAHVEEEFAAGLSVLRSHTAWTRGSWRFSDSEAVPWNKIGNSSRRVNALAQHLVSVVRRGSIHEVKLVPSAARSRGR